MSISTDLNAMMQQYPDNIPIGKHETYGFVNLRRPSFDCDWYWGFGYLGNRRCHFHLDGLREGENIHLYDAIKKRFGDTFVIQNSGRLWKFVEVVKTVYTLRKSAELFHLGGSHCTSNPDRDMLKRPDLWEEINRVLIPRQIAAMYAIIEEEKAAVK